MDLAPAKSQGNNDFFRELCAEFVIILSKIQKPVRDHPNFEKERSRSEKAILGATLETPGYSRSYSRSGSHDLIYVKALFSEQLSERLSELVGRQDLNTASLSQKDSAVFFKFFWNIFLFRGGSSSKT